MFAEDIKKLWLSINDVAGPIADLSDRYIPLARGMHPRFSQLREVCTNLHTIEGVLYEFLEMKAPTFGKKPEREFFMLAQAAMQNAKVLLEIATGEFELLTKRT